MTAPGPSNVTEDCEEEYEVEYIIDSHYKGKHLEYLIHWKGWSETDRTWEPMSHLEHAADAVREFHASNPSAPHHLQGITPLTFFSYSTMSGRCLLSLCLRRLITWKSILRRGAVLHTLRPPWYSFSFFFLCHCLLLHS